MRRGTTSRFAAALATLPFLILLSGCRPHPQATLKPARSSFSPSPALTTAAPPSAAGVPRGEIRIHLCRVCVRSAAGAGIGLRDVVRATIRQAETILPLPATRVSVRADPRATIPELGVGGFTDVVTGHVFISMDPTFHDRQAALRTWLPLTLAHELDHAQRVLDGPGYGRTLLQAMVSEGLADAFAGQVFPAGPSMPWDHALSPATERVVWAFARPRLGHLQNSGRHAEWFYGTGPVPRWAGYTIGYDIVESYLRSHPGTTPASITDLPARRILRESTFRP
jgi:hypothetical protein